MLKQVAVYGSALWHHGALPFAIYSVIEGCACAGCGRLLVAGELVTLHKTAVAPALWPYCSGCWPFVVRGDLPYWWFAKDY